jgi:DNA-binding transcriptional LysR family regulator
VDADGDEPVTREQPLSPVDAAPAGPDISELRLDEQIELRHLRYFLAVADAGSMTEGARRLQLAQSPLSQQIRQLEARLGVTLFERARGRAAQLTEAGHVLYVRAQQIMGALDEASEEVRGVASGSSGRLRFGAVPTIAPHLTRPLQSFAQRYPQVMVLFREAGAERLAAEIQSGDIDMGFARLPIPPTDIDVRVLWEEEFLLALPPDHYLAHMEELPLKAIADERFVAFDRQKAWYLFQIIEAACEKEGFRPRVVCDGASFLTVARLVGAGYGVSVLPRSAVEPIRRPHPVMVPIAGKPVKTAIAGLYPKRSNPAPLITAWIDHVDQWIHSAPEEGGMPAGMGGKVSS